jgi:hypothetical protein
MKKAFITLITVFSITNLYSQTLEDCSTCSTQLLKAEQLKELSIDEIRFLTNEIYARKGYQFDNFNLQQYFADKLWYKSKNDNKSIVLNDIEKQNTKILQARTTYLKAARVEIVRQLKIFKSLVLADKKEELMSQFNFFYQEEEAEVKKLLKEVLNKINLDDINYYKNKGLNNNMVDNGFVQVFHKVSISGQKVNLVYNYASKSDIIEDFDEYTEYRSENEFAFYWQFELINNKLKFLELIVAG